MLMTWLGLVGCSVGLTVGVDPKSGSGDDTDPTTGLNITGCEENCDGIASTTRFARLTHVQWENTVADVFGPDAPRGLSAQFLGDTLSGGFDNNAENLEVSPDLFLDYQRAAETMSAAVVSDPALYAWVVPQDPRTGASSRTWSERVLADDPSITSSVGDHYGVGTDSVWMLWSGGTMQAPFDLPYTGTYKVRAYVWADQPSADLVEAKVGFDGVDLLDTGVTSTTSAAPELLETEVTTGMGPHTVSVTFEDPGDGIDRNLWVAWMEVEAVPSVLGTSSAGTAERDAWIDAFGTRMHRHPLDADQTAAYTALFDQGPELVATGDDFADGAELVIEAMLQSPYFLYRIESSTAQDEQGRVPLDDYEIASKLSYAIWNTMPDDELFRAAAAGELETAEGVRTQATRLLADPRAATTVGDLHRQLLLLDNYQNISKTDFAEWSDDLPAAMKAEAMDTVDDVYNNGGGLHELMTTNRTYVNQALAKVYGLSGITGDAMTPVELDPSERAGLFTQIGFLAMYSDGGTSNPILRGAFLNFKMLCIDLPEPPANATPLPEPDGTMTTRQRVEAHTGMGTCGDACHPVINPPGYGLENFDGLGRYRTEEVGLPIDAASSYKFKDGEQSWDDAIGMAEAFSNSLQVHRCYAQHLLEYTHGRLVDSRDSVMLDELGATSLDQDLSIEDLLLTLVSTDSFRFRSPEVE